MTSKEKVEYIMTKGVYTVDVDDTVRKADEIMRTQNVRHVPVLEGRKFVGLITERTLIEYSLKNIYDYDDNMGDDGLSKISDFQHLMDKKYHLIYPEDSIRKAVEVMTKYKMDCLPVVDWEKNLVGIITSFDIMLFLHKRLVEDDGGI